MCSDVILSDVIFELADVDLALLRCSLFHCNLLALDNVLLGQNFVESVNILEDDECETPATNIELILKGLVIFAIILNGCIFLNGTI